MSTKKFGGVSEVTDPQKLGWLLGWLELISVGRMGIKSAISPPEGHVGCAKLSSSSAKILP